MNHKEYIGKKLRDLISDPSMSAIYYLVVTKKRTYHLGDIMNDEEYLDQTITEISSLCSDYTYWIKLDE